MSRYIDKRLNFSSQESFMYNVNLSSCTATITYYILSFITILPTMYNVLYIGIPTRKAKI